MNRADVVLLNNSLDQLGNSLLQRQVMAQRNEEIANQKADRAAQRSLQSQQIDVANQRYGAQEAHYNRMESTQQDAAKAAAADRAQKNAQDLLKDIFSANAQGQFDDDQIDQVNSMLAEHPILSKAGIQISKPAVKQSTLSAAALTDKYAATLDDQADTIEGNAASESDATATDRQTMLAKAKSIRDRAAALRSTLAKPAPDAFQDVTTEEQPGGLGTAKTIVKRKVPAGQPAVQPKTITDRQGKSWVYKGAMPDPTKDKNPANWQPAGQ